MPKQFSLTFVFRKLFPPFRENIPYTPAHRRQNSFPRIPRCPLRRSTAQNTLCSSLGAKRKPEKPYVYFVTARQAENLVAFTSDFRTKHDSAPVYGRFSGAGFFGRRSTAQNTLCSSLGAKRKPEKPYVYFVTARQAENLVAFTSDFRTKHDSAPVYGRFSGAGFFGRRSTAQKYALFKSRSKTETRKAVCDLRDGAASGKPLRFHT